MPVSDAGRWNARRASQRKVPPFMEIKKGIGVSSGVVVCQALLLLDDDLRIGRRAIPSTQIESERQRLSDALSSSRADIRQLRDQTARDLGQETGAIFNFHLGLLDD